MDVEIHSVSEHMSFEGNRKADRAVKRAENRAGT